MGKPRQSLPETGSKLNWMRKKSNCCAMQLKGFQLSLTGTTVFCFFIFFVYLEKMSATHKWVYTKRKALSRN